MPLWIKPHKQCRFGQDDGHAMILLNFAHPLGAGQAAVMEIDCWIDPVRALGPQVVALVDGVGFVASGVADAAAVD